MKVRNSQPVPYQMAARILLPVARALEYTHHQNIIHCNVNATNILLTDDCQPVLADFGEAKNLGLEEGNSFAMPGYGTEVPTPMEYEQGMPQISPQTDIYALGIVFYELLTGHLPFDASTSDAVMQKQKTGSLQSPKYLVPDLADEVE